MSPIDLKSKPSLKIADIQILRALAIIAVLIAHLSLPATLLDNIPAKPISPFAIGLIGVELFFVISGFIVTKTVIEGSSMNAGLFLTRRAFRLLPAMFAFVALSGLAVFLAFCFAASDPFAEQNLIVTPTEFIRQSLSVLGGYLINRGGPSLYTNSAMWSLSVEFQFYASFAVVLAIVGTLRLSPQIARWLILSFAIGVYSLTLWHRLSIATAGAVPLPSGSASIYLMAWRFDFMALGVITYYIYRSGFVIRRFGIALSASALLTPFAISIACESHVAAVSKNLMDGVGQIAIGLCFALTVLLAARESAFGGKDTFASRLLVWIGNRSYSLYLVHYPVMAIVWVAILRLYPAAFSSGLVYGTVQAVLVLTMAAYMSDFCYRRIEIKGADLGKKAIGQLRAALDSSRQPLLVKPAGPADGPKQTKK